MAAIACRSPGVARCIRIGQCIHLGSEHVAKDLLETRQRGFVDTLARLVERAVDDRDEVSIFEPSAVPEVGVMRCETGQRSTGLIHRHAGDLIAFGQVAHVFHE